MSHNITIVYNTVLYVYKFRVNLIQKIQQLGYKVIVIAPEDEHVEKLNDLGIIYHPITMSQYGLNPISEIKTIVEIYRALKFYNPSYSLHFTLKPNILGGLAAYFSNTKVINNITGIGKAFSKQNSFFGKFIIFLLKLSLSRSSKVLFQNNEDLDFFVKNNIVKLEQASRIPGSGVDLVKYQTKSNTVNNTFLFIGRLLVEKGVCEYLESAKKILKSHPDSVFLLVGEHENRPEYINEELLNRFLQNKNIEYLGSYPTDEMPSIIDKSSCVVLPSYYNEGVPRSLLEAAAMSKAIITTDHKGCRDVVDNNLNGWKCKIKDIDSLCQCMINYLCLESEQKRQMGLNGRNKVATEFDEKIVINTYTNLIVNAR